LTLSSKDLENLSEMERSKLETWKKKIENPLSKYKLVGYLDLKLNDIDETQN